MIKTFLSQQLKLPLHRIINYRSFMDKDITPATVKWMTLAPTEREDVFELRYGFKPEEPLQVLTVEVHHPAEPFATVSEYPLDLSANYRTQISPLVKVLRWKTSCPGWVGIEIPFSEAIPIPGLLIKNPKDFLDFINQELQRRNTLLDNVLRSFTFKTLRHQDKSSVEERDRLYTTLVSGLTENDVASMLSLSTVGDVLYFRVFHFQFENKVHLKAFYTLAGKTFVYNKIVECMGDLISLPLKV